MVLRVIVAVFVVLALVLVGLVVYSYAQIDVEVQGLESVSPVYDVGLESATSAARQVLRGDPGGALKTVASGLRVDVVVEIRNGEVLPVLVPGTKHVVFLGSRPEDAYERAPGNPGFWLRPGESRSIEIS